MVSNHFFKIFVFSLIVLSFVSVVGRAYETDQYTDRTRPIKDSLDVMNEMMNARILAVTLKWQPKWGQSPDLLVSKVHGLGLPWNLWIGPERESETSPLIDRRYTSPQNIYYNATIKGARWGYCEKWNPKIFDDRLNWICRVSSTINMNGVELGTDKIGHFLSEGFKYYQIAVVQKRGEKSAIQFGVHAENTYFGLKLTGVYSNADLVANFEGYRFYRSLSEDNIVPGKPAIIKWVDGHPVIQRPFDWRDHINEMWDEALNVSVLTPDLQRTVSANLRNLCGQYAQAPELYVPKNETELEARYSNIGFIPNPQNRMDHVCDPQNFH